MREPSLSIAKMIAAFARKFRSATNGNVALVASISMLAISLAAGSSFDLARSYNARQKLSEVARLACQYAGRASIAQIDTAAYSGSNADAAYSAKVTSFISATWANQKLGLTQTNASPFTFTPGGAATVSLSASVTTSFLKLANMSAIPISVSLYCYDAPTPSGTTSAMPVQESFENTSLCGGGWCPIQKTYTGKYGNNWTIMGYCLEVDQVGLISSTVPDGNFSAELDCDNGSGTAGNSSMSTQVYLTAGNYELRYNYRSRVDYPNYDPVYICGSAASDVAWANDTYSPTGPLYTSLRTNQINVYLDEGNGTTPPTHSQMFGGAVLGGSNLIDVCVYSPTWVERSVRIKITSPGNYWLSFAADGQDDSYGGQVDNIRLCSGTCTGTVQDNFPAAWVSSPLLFEDMFESPTCYCTNFASQINYMGDASTFYGTSGTSSSGWPNASATGWAAAPYNQLSVMFGNAYQWNQAIVLAGPNWDNAHPTTNRLLSRPFLLDPGYYKVTYGYLSNFYYQSGIQSVTCQAAPASGNIFGNGYSATRTAQNRYGLGGTYDGFANLVSVFMANGQLVSTPAIGGALGSTTSYNNPDGTVTTTAKVPPDKVTLTSYDATASNPLIDVCLYAPYYNWTGRTTYVKITKPGLYWLTFAGQYDVTNSKYVGGSVDDVKLTAMGSLTMSGAPSNAVTIPVPNPQPGASTSFTGFQITSDPLSVPAPTL